MTLLLALRVLLTMQNREEHLAMGSMGSMGSMVLVVKEKKIIIITVTIKSS